MRVTRLRLLAAATVAVLIAWAAPAVDAQPGALFTPVNEPPPSGPLDDITLRSRVVTIEPRATRPRPGRGRRTPRPGPTHQSPVRAYRHATGGARPGHDPDLESVRRHRGHGHCRVDGTDLFGRLCDIGSPR